MERRQASRDGGKALRGLRPEAAVFAYRRHVIASGSGTVSSDRRQHRAGAGRVRH